MKTAARRAAAIATLIGLSAVVAFEFYVVTVQQEGDQPLPPNFGNFARNRKALELQPPKAQFSFAVMGDTRSAGTFERLAQSLRDVPLDFAVLLGDFAETGTEAAHRYFRAECTSEFAEPFPVFFVVGNHDVGESDFPVWRFERQYGPTLCSFEYQQCLFIILRVLDPPYSNRASLDFLRGLPDADTPGFRHRFVFMHIPPPVSEGWSARRYDDSEELVSLLNAKGIDYVFAGDFHGYSRAKVGRTNYLVSGGGGANLNEKRYTQFHHAIVVTVGKDSVAERIVPVRTTTDIEDLIERSAITGVWPFLVNHPILACGLNGLAILAMVAATRTLRRPKGRQQTEVL